MRAGPQSCRAAAAPTSITSKNPSSSGDDTASGAAAWCPNEKPHAVQDEDVPLDRHAGGIDVMMLRWNSVITMSPSAVGQAPVAVSSTIGKPISTAVAT